MIADIDFSQGLQNAWDHIIAFVPKFIVFLVAFGVMAPWMLGRLKEFGLAMFAQLIAVR